LEEWFIVEEEVAVLVVDRRMMDILTLFGCPILGIEVTLIISSDIVPSLLKLIVSSPHERGVVVLVDEFDCAVGELKHLGLIQDLLTIGPAHPIFNQSLAIVPLILTKWSVLGNCSVNGAVGGVSIRWALIVGIWTLDSFALGLVCCCGIVESEQPVSAVVSGESPLTHPDLEFAGQVFGEIIVRDVPSAEFFGVLDVSGVPKSHVPMTVHSDLVPIAIWEELWPHWVRWSETIMEHKVGSGCKSSH